MKKKLIVFAVILLIPLLTILFVGRTFYPDNIAETSPEGGAKDLKSRVYKTDSKTAEKFVKEIIPTLSTYGSNWKLIESGNQNLIKAEVPVVFFTDDLEVKLQEEPDRKIRVDVRSASRVGKSDFGENRRHVVQILEALDKKFGSIQ